MWILASRGRPHNFKRFIDAWIKTDASTPVYVRLDLCDPKIDEYKKIDVPNEFRVIVDKRARLGPAMDEMFKKFPHEEFYGLIADDVIPRSKHWDIKLKAAASNKFIAGANDLTKKPKLYCHPCIGGDLVRKAGFFGFPLNTHYSLEVVWKDLTKADKRFGKYLSDVIVENSHPEFGKDSYDQTYAEANMVKKQDQKNYEEWKKNNFNDFLVKMQTILD